MFAKFFGSFSQDLGIDLGTANTLVYSRDKGIIINEPSVVAINNRTGQVLAVGQAARDMMGKTPGYLTTSRPLSKGIISDFEVTEKMLRYFIDRVQRGGFFLSPRPRVVIGVPLEITEVERKAVEDAVLSAGAREVALVENTMAAAIGARLPVNESVGTMIVDIGGGTTDIAVISMSGIVTWKSLPVAGDEMNRNIVQYAREHFNLMVGDRVTNYIRKAVGCLRAATRCQYTNACESPNPPRSHKSRPSVIRRFACISRLASRRPLAAGEPPPFVGHGRERDERRLRPVHFGDGRAGRRPDRSDGRRDNPSKIKLCAFFPISACGSSAYWRRF
jgi:molecular chaperone DnaK (HSP70)